LFQEQYEKLVDQMLTEDERSDPDNDATVLNVLHYMADYENCGDDQVRRCYDFLNIFAEKFSEKNGVFDSKQS
jgi:hypothetical protein